MRILVFTGAGMSAESGLKTFRDSDGLWENHSVEEVATPQAWQNDPELVHRFYNERRKQLFTVEPNAAHIYIAELQKRMDVAVVTQNVDDLHERAGSTSVLHLHGQLTQGRCEVHENEVFDLADRQLSTQDLAPCGNRLRPNVVWFGEAVPVYSQALVEAEKADAMLVIGSSLQVYPAAGLLMETRPGIPMAYLDPGPNPMTGMLDILHIQKKASEGINDVEAWLQQIPEL